MEIGPLTDPTVHATEVIRTMRSHRLFLLPAVAVLALACSSPASTGGAATVAPVTSAAASDAAASGAAAITKVSANSASHDQLVTALTAAGVTNAERWAREVEEYRPYDTTDPTLGHLQSELAKYDPDAATLAAILSALQP